MTSLPVRYRAATSHRIDVAGQGRLRKDLSEAGWLSPAGTRPCFLHDPEREPAAYRALLGPAGVGPRCIASGRDWVEMEHVRGVALWQVGDVAVWVAAARALAETHHLLRPMVDKEVPFLRNDSQLATRWRRRAEASGVPGDVLAAHERGWQRLKDVQVTVIHGDAYPSNVLVRHDDTFAEPEITFIDWELVGLGPAVLDLAALTAGSWPLNAVSAMTEAYFETATGLATTEAPWESWNADLDAARLHLCVQWAGWANGWRPPKAHRRDWLSDARALVERM